MTINLWLFFPVFLVQPRSMCTEFFSPLSSYNHTESDNPHTEKTKPLCTKNILFFCYKPWFSSSWGPTRTVSLHNTIWHWPNASPMLIICWNLIGLSLPQKKDFIHAQTRVLLTLPTKKKKKNCIVFSASLKKPPLPVFFTQLEKPDLVEVHTVHWWHRDGL